MIIRARFVVVGAIAVLSLLVLDLRPVFGDSANLANGLIAYWTMDEVSGTRADSVGGHNLTDTDNVDSTAGVIGNAADFTDPTDQALSTGPVLDGESSFSVSLWYKTDGTVAPGGSSTMWGEDDLGAGSYIYHDGTDVYFGPGGFDSPDPKDLSLTEPLIKNVWTHVVMTWDATSGTLDVYSNGSLQDTTTDETAIGESYTPATSTGIGGFGDFPSIGFQGQIDEVGVWNRTLNSSEVSDLYNGGSGMSYADIIASAPAPTPTPAVGGHGRHPEFEAPIEQAEITVTPTLAPTPTPSSSSGPTPTPTLTPTPYPSSTPTPVPVPSYHFTKYLYRGMHNDEVLHLQFKLQQLGFFPAFQIPTGYFGPITVSAVKAFQKASGISPVGYVGPATRAALNR